MSENGMLAAMHMLAGTRQAMWELYLTQLATGKVRRMPRNPDNVEFLCADMWCQAFRFGELAHDIAKLSDWAHNLSKNLREVCETQEQHRHWGFGPPDPRLGWYPYETGRKAKQPLLR